MVTAERKEAGGRSRWQEQEARSIEQFPPATSYSCSCLLSCPALPAVTFPPRLVSYSWEANEGPPYTIQDKPGVKEEK
jgi:hypothetical protein